MMTDDEKATIAEGLAKLAIAFGTNLSEVRCDIYIEQLRDLPFLNVVQAIHQSLKTQEFFPTVATLRKAAGDSGLQSPDRALMAWHNLRQLTGRRPFNITALEDPLTKKCFMQMGGPSTFGMWDYDRDEDFKRKLFCDLYQAYARRPDQLTLAPSETLELAKFGLGQIAPELTAMSSSTDLGNDLGRPPKIQEAQQEEQRPGKGPTASVSK